MATGGAATPALAADAGEALELGSFLGTEGASSLGTLGRVGEEAAPLGSIGTASPSLLSLTGRSAAKAFAAPSATVSRLGDAVESGVAKLLGEDATSLLGKIAQKAPAQALRGGVEGAIYNAADTWGGGKKT